MEKGPARVHRRLCTELKCILVTLGFRGRFNGEDKISITARRDISYWTAARLMLYLLLSPQFWEARVAVPMSQVRNQRMGTVGLLPQVTLLGRAGLGLELRRASLHRTFSLQRAAPSSLREHTAFFSGHCCSRLPFRTWLWGQSSPSLADRVVCPEPENCSRPLSASLCLRVPGPMASMPVIHLQGH